MSSEQPEVVEAVVVSTESTKALSTSRSLSEKFTGEGEDAMSLFHSILSTYAYEYDSMSDKEDPDAQKPFMNRMTALKDLSQIVDKLQRAQSSFDFELDMVIQTVVSKFLRELATTLHQIAVQDMDKSDMVAALRSVPTKLKNTVTFESLRSACIEEVQSDRLRKRR